jgi:hypothetical protein
MFEKGFTTEMAVAFTRMCRPGSIFGHQSAILSKFEHHMVDLMWGKTGKSFDKANVLQVDYDENRPFRHAAKFYHKKPARLTDHLPKNLRAQFQGVYEEVQEKKEADYERSVAFLKQMNVCKVGSSNKGFKVEYSKYADCFSGQDRPMPMDEEKRIAKMLRPWISKGK